MVNKVVYNTKTYTYMPRLGRYNVTEQRGTRGGGRPRGDRIEGGWIYSD